MTAWQVGTCIFENIWLQYLQSLNCPEQLLLLSLIIDIARKTGNTLYILFVDFEKAYDKVSHQKLLTLLAKQGCAAQFLSAIANTLKDTHNIISSKSFKVTAEVHRGGATSCSLFTFYVNAIIRKVNEIGPEGFLKMVHLLMLMDDTVIFTTSRRAMEQKLALLMETTVALHMSCHPVKSKFMTINTSNALSSMTLLYCTLTHMSTSTPQHQMPPCKNRWQTIWVWRSVMWGSSVKKCQVDFLKKSESQTRLWN